jgi:hypothetical protein
MIAYEADSKARKRPAEMQETGSRKMPHAMCKVQRVAAVRRIHLANL